MSGVFTLLSAGTGRGRSDVVLCLDGYGGLEVSVAYLIPLSGVTSYGGSNRCFSLLFVCLLILLLVHLIFLSYVKV
jgi:hypothetical protein